MTTEQRIFTYTWVNITNGRSGISTMTEDKLLKEAYHWSIPRSLSLNHMFDSLLYKWNVQQPNNWQYIRLMD